MADMLIGFSEPKGYYTPTVRIDIVFKRNKELSEMLSFLLKFVKANRLQLVPCEESSNRPYPRVDSKYPSGISIFAGFKTMDDVKKFYQKFKMP